MSIAEQSTSKTPDHVPVELVRDIDINVFTAAFKNPYEAAAHLHEGPDIFWATTAANGHPGWVLTRRALVQEAYLDPEHFSSERANLAALGFNWKLNPLEFDPPEHYKYRRLLNPLFSPRAVAEMEEPVKAICDELFDAITGRTSCEFIGDFAEKFPSYVFLDLMGMSREMLPQFLEWERLLLRAEDPRERAGAMMSVFGYLKRFIDEQRAQPTTALMQTILAARYEGERPLTEDEVMGMVALLYIGGLDTVYSSLGWIFHHLAGDKALQERLRANHELIPQAIEEFMRAFPVAQPHRQIRQDFEFHGVKMRKGDHVLMATFAANRDPLVYENPHVVDVDRKPRQLTFAAGPHLCLGIHLARRELRIVVEAFLSRCRNIRTPAAEKLEFHTGGTWGIDRLVLEWDPV